MNSYFAYTRVSTVKQGERGSSLQEQKSAIEAYAGRHNLTIAGWFEEMETAAKLGRRMFNRMLSELENGSAAGVIIHKIDRSARNLKDWAHLGELIDRGVEVHFAHESLDLHSRGGRLSADIQAVVAADYIRNLRDEVRKGFYGRLKQGFYPLPAPIGYLDRGKAKFKEPDPARAPLVREMFELYASNRYNLDTLRTEMHRRGLSGPTGRKLSKTGIAHTLHNPFYAGIIKIRSTGEVFEGGHDPLISKALFDTVQARLSGKTFAYRAKQAHTYRRMITCAKCSRSLVGERQKARVYYRCHSDGCQGTSIREDQVEGRLHDLFARLTFTDDEMADLRDLAKEAGVKEGEAVTERRAQHQRNLGLCEDRLARLTDAFLDANIDKETFEARKLALFSERAALKEAINRPETASVSGGLLEKLELGNTAKIRFDSEFPDEKRDTVEFLASNLSVEGKYLAIRLRFPFDEVEKRHAVLHGGPSHTDSRTGIALSSSDKLWHGLVDRYLSDAGSSI